jgi:hypothetical protein
MKKHLGRDVACLKLKGFFGRESDGRKSKNRVHSSNAHEATLFRAGGAAISTG